MTAAPPKPFFDYADKYLRELEKEGNFQTYKNYCSSLKKFKSFTKKDVCFQEIDAKLLKKYNRHLSENLNNSANTVYNNLKVLRKLFYKAINEEIIGYDDNPFLYLKLKKEEPEKDFLTEDELWQVELLSYGRKNALEHHRKMFLFSCYTGLKISEIQDLKWKNYENGKIIYSQNGNPFRVKIINRALQVIHFYQTLSINIDPEDTIFPVHSFPYINRNLKVIAEDAGIGKNLYFNMGRNTFIFIALKKGIRADQIAKLLGIKNLTTIQKYTEYLNNDLDLVVGKLNQEFM